MNFFFRRDLLFSIVQLIYIWNHSVFADLIIIIVSFPQVIDTTPLLLFICFLFFFGFVCSWRGTVSSYLITSLHSAILNHGTSVHYMKMCIMQVVSNANNEKDKTCIWSKTGNLTKTLLIVHGRFLYMPHYFLHLHIKRKSAPPPIVV